ncbi:MAG: hypothetical protein SW833_10550 [Cyanobacteriota bacterium]|nr:hypothetical protein [Cyanobacteriota bacterium]
MRAKGAIFILTQSTSKSDRLLSTLTDSLPKAMTKKRSRSAYRTTSRVSFPRILSSLSVYLFILLGGILVVGLQIPQLNALKRQGTDISPETYKQEVRQLKTHLAFLQNLPAFGFDNLLADWVLLQYFQYFGDDEARAVTGYELVPDYFDIILDRDPRFLQAYYFLATGGPLYAAQPEETNTIMERGLQFVTPQVPRKSYYILRHKAINELLFLPDSQQQAQQTFEKSAEWAETYNDEESQSVARASRMTAQFLANNPESTTAKVSAWAMVLQTVPDERTQNIAIGQIEALGGQVRRSSQGTFQVIPPAKD